VQEMKENTKEFQQDKLAFIKNPAVLEFLGLPGNSGYTETALEQAIINQMQKFLLEMGKGFAFDELTAEIERQKEIFAMSRLNN